MQAGLRGESCSINVVPLFVMEKLYMEKKLKIFLPYDEQIALLESRNLEIPNKEDAQHYLETLGYFELINGYKDLFLTKRHPEEKYRDNSQFIDIVNLYMYDYQLRLDLLAAIYIIEKSIKSTISYVFSNRYGENHDNYLQPTSFDERPENAERVASTIQTMRDIITDNQAKGNKLICHYLNNHGYVPLWVLFNFATFGNVSVFYANLKDKEQVDIANHYGLSPSRLKSITRFITAVRNACAHGKRIYTLGSDLVRPLTIPNMPIRNSLTIPANTGTCDLVAVLICCYYLLPYKSFKELIDNLKHGLDSIKQERFYSSILNKTHLQRRNLDTLLMSKSQT